MPEGDGFSYDHGDMNAKKSLLLMTVVELELFTKYSAEGEGSGSTDNGEVLIGDGTYFYY